jgi:hypothetical protein
MNPHEDAVRAVVAAWSNPGRNPAWHEAWKRHIRSEWPVLGNALDELVRR